jgi:hypothetical protein
MQCTKNLLNKQIRKGGSLLLSRKLIMKKTLGVVLTGAAVSAQAAVPESVTTAIGTAVTDIGTIGALILGVVVAIAGFAWIRRPIR